MRPQSRNRARPPREITVEIFRGGVVRLTSGGSDECHVASIPIGRTDSSIILHDSDASRDRPACSGRSGHPLSSGHTMRFELSASPTSDRQCASFVWLSASSALAGHDQVSDDEKQGPPRATRVSIRETTRSLARVRGRDRRDLCPVSIGRRCCGYQEGGRRFQRRAELGKIDRAPGAA